MFKFKAALLAVLLFVISGHVMASPVNDMAPDFKLRGMDQNIYILGELRDPAYVLLVFGSADCVHCRAQTPVLNEWHKLYSDEQLRIVAINAVQESLEKTREYMKQHQVDYLVLNNQHFNQAVVDAYGIRITPTNILVSPDGRIVYQGHTLPDIRQWLNPVDVTPAEISTQPESPE